MAGERRFGARVLSCALLSLVGACARLLSIDQVSAWSQDGAGHEDGSLVDSRLDEAPLDSGVEANADVLQERRFEESITDGHFGERSDQDGDGPGVDRTTTDANEEPPLVDVGPRDPALEAPRLIAPLSTATVTSQRPQLRWVLATGTQGARVEICKDRACTVIVMTADVSGTSWTLPIPLSKGVYFWRAYGRSAVLAGLKTTPTWQFSVGNRDALVKSSWGTTLDINGDGYADAAIGAPAIDSNTGRAYLYMGTPSGLSTAPATTLMGPDGARGEFGSSIACAGDVNGDGFADLAVGAYALAGFTGRVYVYFGSPLGISNLPDMTLLAPDGLNSAFGSSVASAGDMNGDGYADLVVGAKGTGFGAGGALVYLGGPSGPVLDTPISFLQGDGDKLFGASVAGAGDLDGDEYGDVVIGENGVGNINGPAVYVFLGAAQRTTSVTWNPPAVVLRGRPGTTQFGTSVASAGDINGDGYADLVAGDMESPTNDMGVALVYYGGRTVRSGTLLDNSITAGPTNSGFGRSVASADIDGDGFSDVIVGAEAFGGLAYVFHGTALGVSVHKELLTGPDGGGFGVALASGDVEGDGYPDIILGAPAANGGTGRAYVYSGSPSGLPPDPTLTLTGPDPLGDFGAALAR
jgi:hypothetical protein